MSVHSPSVPQTPTSTLPRPPRPPKPEHLSSAFTGTLNGAALREYIKAQKTGESASSFGSVRSSSSSSSRERERQGEGERDCESRYSVEGEGDRHGKGEGGDTYRPKSRSGKDANERTQISQLFGRGGAFAHERHDLGVDDIEGHSRYSTATSNATLRPVRGNANAIHAHAQQGSALIDSFRTAPETREWAEAARLSAVEHQHQQEQRDSRIGRTSRPVSAMSANEEFDDEDGGHERDESSATIKPSTYKRGSTPSVATAFGFTPNSNTPLKNAPTVAGAREPRSSVFSVAEAPEPSEVDGGGDGENETEGDISFDRETERSRAPSVLIHGEELAGFELHGHAHVQAQAQAHQHQHPSDRQEQERQRESFATTSTDHDQAGETQTHMQMPARPESIALDLDSEVHLDARTQMEGEGEGADEEADELQPLPLPPIASQGASSSSSTAATSNVQASHPHPHPHPQLQIPRGRPARALYDFIGEPAFNELSVLAGQCFEILNEELAGGWSLAVVRGGSAGGGMGGTGEVEVAEADRRGLVPRGWYCVSIGHLFDCFGRSSALFRPGQR